jgi:diguanylate cyclase (GGDEF)-like protein
MIARKFAMGFAVLLSLAMVGGAGYYLAKTVEASRSEILDEFSLRSTTAATAIAVTLGASDAKTRALGGSAFSGSAVQLQEQAPEQRQLLGTPWYAVLKVDGTQLLAYPSAYNATTRNLRANSGFRIAQQTGHLAYGEVTADMSGENVAAFQPFNAIDGLRMLVAPIPVSELSGLFSSTLSAPDGNSYLIDGVGHVVVATGSDIRSPDDAVLAAQRSKDRGVVGDIYFSSSPVPWTDWLVITATSQSALLAPVEATERVARRMFAAFGMAMMVILLIGAAALLSFSRLARARQHDPLTRLPNRALFMERTEAAILEWRRRRQNNVEGTLATLFLDLDGFKPVNDMYGHAAGDNLLQQVALRLIDATRPDDYVSRLGGDEFVVLCCGFRTDDDAYVVADRIKAYLAEPFVIGNRTVEIGVSIGIATLEDQFQEAAGLLHNADLALYQAKEKGRGRVERFTPDMAEQSH